MFNKLPKLTIRNVTVNGMVMGCDFDEPDTPQLEEPRTPMVDQLVHKSSVKADLTINAVADRVSIQTVLTV